MGILDSVKSLFGGGGNQQANLMSEVMNLVGGQSGGLNGLISQFASQGLGHLVSSWIGTGNNLPISSDQVNQVVGEDNIQQMASKLGMDKNSLLDHLSNLLPQVVDKLTPEGQVPEGDIMSKGMEILGGLLGKK